MAKKAYYEVAMQVNEAFYRVRKADIEDSAADLECGDAEDGRFEDRIPGRKVATINAENATWDPDLNPMALPFRLTAGQVVAIKFYPDGVAGDFDDFPQVLININKRSGDVTGLQPVSFTGKTKGEYTMLGEETY